MAAVVKTEDCVGCGTCVDACPAEAIKLEGDVAQVSADDCLECGVCVDECPSGAISLP